MTCATCQSFDHNICLLEADHLFKWSICAVGSKGYCLSIVFLNPKIAVMHWLDPKSHKEPFMVFPTYWLLGPNDLVIGPPFDKKKLLTMTLQPCSLLFNVQDMIIVGSSGFFNHASTSVDGCYLYIIIHYGMSQ